MKTHHIGFVLVSILLVRETACCLPCYDEYTTTHKDLLIIEFTWKCALEEDWHLPSSRSCNASTQDAMSMTDKALHLLSQTVQTEETYVVIAQAPKVTEPDYDLPLSGDPAVMARRFERYVALEKANLARIRKSRQRASDANWEQRMEYLFRDLGILAPRDVIDEASRMLREQWWCRF